MVRDYRRLRVVGYLGFAGSLAEVHFGQVLAEGDAVQFPHGNEKGGHQRTDQHAGNTEHQDAAEGAEKDHQLVHLGILADENRAQHVIQAADDETAKSHQADAGAGVALHDQDDRSRNPDQRRADAGDDRQYSHDRAPEHGIVDAGHGEGDAGEAALQDADSEAALDHRPRHRGKLFQHQGFVVVVQRQVIQDLAHQLVAVHLQEIHRVQKHEGHEQEVDRTESRLRETADDPVADRAHELARFFQDGPAIRFEVIVNRQSLQVSCQRVGLFQVTLDPRRYRLADIDCLADDDPDQQHQGQQYHHDHHQQRGHRCHMPMAPEQVPEASIHRARQRAEQPGQENGHQELMDHREEQRGNGDHHQRQHDSIDLVLLHCVPPPV